MGEAVTARPTEDGVVAIVVSYASESTIDECLTRLRHADAVTQIRVVDNGFEDDTLRIVQSHALADARVRFIANPDNPGFAVACNQGAAASDAPWLAFVNPDCFVETDTLSRLRDHAVATARPSLVGADLVDEHGVRDSAARRRDPHFAAMLRQHDARDLAVPPDDKVALQGVDAISGALMVVSRTLFLKIGGFDRNYRLHAEDLDLCRRVRAVGADVFVANDVRVLHLRGVSAQSRPWFVEWHKHRGLWRYFKTYEAPKRSVMTCALVFLSISGHFCLSRIRDA